jgi:hypothetical protein
VDVPVSLAMRYGNPSLCQGYKNYMIKVLLSDAFPFVPATCYGIYNNNIRIAEDHRKSIFQK